MYVLLPSFRVRTLRTAFGKKFNLYLNTDTDEDVTRYLGLMVPLFVVPNRNDLEGDCVLHTSSVTFNFQKYLILL